MLGILDDFGSYNPYPVAASGFLLGTQVTLVLFGLHVGQIFRYYYRFGHDDRKAYRYGLVPAVFVVSATHIALVVVSMYHYYVEGILRPQVWGAFYWGLSSQDLLIPVMSSIAHVFFGHRIWRLAAIKRKWWLVYLACVLVTLGFGVAFAALARLWAEDPWVSYEEFTRNPVGPVANVLPTVWLSCAASIDGLLTVSLLYLLLKESKVSGRAKRLVVKIASLTMETVAVTHAIGAILFVLWLTSRTRTNAFWFFIQIISETYALSILFTLNSRKRFWKAARPDSAYMMERQLDIIQRDEEAGTGGNSTRQSPVQTTSYPTLSSDPGRSDMRKAHPSNLRSMAALFRTSTATSSATDSGEASGSNSGDTGTRAASTPRRHRQSTDRTYLEAGPPRKGDTDQSVSASSRSSATAGARDEAGDGPLSAGLDKELMTPSTELDEQGYLPVLGRHRALSAESTVRAADTEPASATRQRRSIGDFAEYPPSSEDAGQRRQPQEGTGTGAPTKRSSRVQWHEAL